MPIKSKAQRRKFAELLVKAKMLPPSGETRSVTERFGTYQFCKARALPMRSFEEAMEAVPSDRSPTAVP